MGVVITLELTVIMYIYCSMGQQLVRQNLRR